jgi:ligand-binding sensor domain-containing protein
MQTKNEGLGIASPTVFAVDTGGTIFAGTNGYGLFSTSDGGAVWGQVAGEDVSNYLLFALDSTGNIYAGESSFESAIFISADNGANWTPVGTLAPSIQALAVKSNGEIFAGGAPVEDILRSTDGGKHWTGSIIGYFADSISAIAINHSGVIFAGTSHRGIFRSTDDGGNWVESNTQLLNLNIRSLAVTNGDDIFAGTWGGGVFRSSNGGGDWSPVNIGLTSNRVQSLAVDDKGDVFAGTDAGGLFRSVDNGGNWMNAFPGSNSTSVFSIFADSLGHVYAAYYPVGVMRSTDDGATWTLMNYGLTNTNVHGLVLTYDRHLIVSTSSGVFRTSGQITLVTEKDEAPFAFTLVQNFPNPFNPVTTIRYELRTPGDVSLNIFDIFGRTISTLVEEKQQAGNHEAVWNAGGFSSGVYFCRLVTKDFIQAKKMILLK